MLTELKLRDFRCFSALECEFAPGINLIVGPNAQGKTSLLEAACVLLRLQSPRSTRLGPLVRLGGTGFVVDGHYGRTHLQFYCSARRKKLARDSVVQPSSVDYLETGRVVWFSNDDMGLVRGPAEERRRYLDFLATQLSPLYRQHLQAYEKALRSRNRLLKAPVIRWREVSAFDEPLLHAGRLLTLSRQRLVDRLSPHATTAHREISGERLEELTLTYRPGAGDDFAQSLEASRDESIRLRQTPVGPHRDEVELRLNTLATSLASEGQQRTVALALRLAQAAVMHAHLGVQPLLLLDDIFGELDPQRRNALLALLPTGAQQIITTTHRDWAQANIARCFEISGGQLQIV